MSEKLCIFYTKLSTWWIDVGFENLKLFVLLAHSNDSINYEDDSGSEDVVEEFRWLKSFLKSTLLKLHQAVLAGREQ